MMSATRWSPDTYKMPRKPIEKAFKFHCLADHGYICDFHPISNQAGFDPPINRWLEFNRTSCIASHVKAPWYNVLDSQFE